MGEDVIQLTDNISQAHALIALQSKLKKNPGIQAAARSHGIPTYVTKTSSLVQITNAVRALLRDHDGSEDTEVEDTLKLSEKTDALEEARVAIEQVVIPKGEHVELLPRSSSIMSLQMDLVRKYQLRSEKIGKEQDIHLRILPYDLGSYEDIDSTDEVVDGFDDFESTNGSAHNISRLPLLSD